MSLETQQAEFGRHSREAAEAAAENRESKEGEVDNELKAGAAMERADIIVKEVRQGKKQMQNIVLHMQSVLLAIRQLRQQLQLAQNDDVDSVKQDKKRVEELKKKIRDYGDELEKMRGDLIREQVKELSRSERDPAVAGKNGVGVGLSSAEMQQKAEEMVEEMIKQVKN